MTTATNIKSGGRTPVAGMIHALVLLLILLFLGKLAVLIPMSALAAILMVVAYNMSEWRSFTSLLKGPRSDIAVLLSTFFITLFFDLSLAIAVGLVMSSFLFMQRMAEISNISAITNELDDDLQKEVLMDKLPEGVQLYAINGPFFFGAAQKYKEAMITLGNTPKVLILRLRHVPFMDASGVHVIEEVQHHCLKNNTVFLMTDLHSQPLHILKTSGFIEKIGHKNVFHTLKKALEHLKTQ
jgi:SulP family sulfate permease